MYMYEIAGIGKVYSNVMRRDLPGHGVIIDRSTIIEAELESKITVNDDGRVYHNDHVYLGVIRHGRFVCDKWAYNVFSMADVRKVRRYLELTWCFKAENLEKMVKMNGCSLYHGAALVADRAAGVIGGAEKWVVSECAACIYSRHQVAAIVGAAG